MPIFSESFQFWYVCCQIAVIFSHCVASPSPFICVLPITFTWPVKVANAFCVLRHFGVQRGDSEVKNTYCPCREPSSVPNTLIRKLPNICNCISQEAKALWIPQVPTYMRIHEGALQMKVKAQLRLTSSTRIRLPVVYYQVAHCQHI